MISRDLFTANIARAADCRDHPFVCGLADGTLDPAIFRAYVAQDAFYLRAFARAYALAAARAPDEAAFGRLQELIAGVSEELSLHAKYAASLGIDLDAVTPMESTRAYVDFLLATAWHRGFAETIAAMAPCMRLYARIGAELAGDGVPDHAYSNWIRTYSSAEFHELADALDDLLDRHATDTPGVRAAYARAMDLEYRFFDQCHG